uniref:tail fiber domain-containing protein n=1 Tax=Psychroserpens mesophilus TaxID=325473 RepID=UPI003F495F93
SDRRLKKDIEDLHYGLKELLVLQPKQYNWKNRKLTEYKSFGLIAQEVQKIMPELVVVGDDVEKILSVNYTELIPILLNALKEQEQIINGYKKELSDLALEVQQIKNSMKALTAQSNQ